MSLVRTTMWVGYTKLINQCRASYTFNINPYPIAVNTLSRVAGGPNDFCSGQPSAGTFGITHLF